MDYNQSETTLQQAAIAPVLLLWRGVLLAPLWVHACAFLVALLVLTAYEGLGVIEEYAGVFALFLFAGLVVNYAVLVGIGLPCVTATG